jgi:hypothetical protein
MQLVAKLNSAGNKKVLLYKAQINTIYAKVNQGFENCEEKLSCLFWSTSMI